MRTISRKTAMMMMPFGRGALRPRKSLRCGKNLEGREEETDSPSRFFTGLLPYQFPSYCKFYISSPTPSSMAFLPFDLSNPAVTVKVPKRKKSKKTKQERSSPQWTEEGEGPQKAEGRGQEVAENGKCKKASVDGSNLQGKVGGRTDGRRMLQQKMKHPPFPLLSF